MSAADRSSSRSGRTASRQHHASAGIAWWGTLVLGLLLVPHALRVSGAFPAASYGSTAGYGGPVYAFEFARSSADLLTVFGPAGDAQQHGRISAMRRGTLLDFPFLIHYAAYLGVFALGLRTHAPTTAWRLGLSGAVLAAAGDAIENVLLLRLLDDLGNNSLLTWLPVPVYLKFLAISLCCCIGGAAIWRAAGLIRILGLLALAGGIVAAVSTLLPAVSGILIGPAITLAWVSMLVFAGLQLRGRRSGAS